MPGRSPLSEDQLREIGAAMEAARSAGDLRRLLCLWLPVKAGLTGARTAAALGCGRAAVCAQWLKFRRGGAGALLDGRRRKTSRAALGALAALLKRAETVRQFQNVQCVLLRQALGLEPRQVAALVGLSQFAAERVLRRYRARGFAGRGGVFADDAAGARAPSAGPAGPGAEEKKLLAAMKHARNVEEFRRAQCLLLRLVLRFEVALAARITGWRRESVCRIVTRYRSEGDALLRSPGRGRKRSRLFSPTAESALLRAVAREQWVEGAMPFSAVHAAFEKAAGHPLEPAVVLDILARHGWAPRLLVARGWAPAELHEAQ